MTPEVRQALNNVYTVFARYQDDYGFARRSGVRRSLQNMTWDDWKRMDDEFDMMLQIYSDLENVFRHYLPLMLEWECEQEGGGFNWDLYSPLVSSGWLHWPSEEVEALRRVFEAWTGAELAKRDGQIPLFFLLEVEDDLGRYLNHWVRARPLEVAQWLWTINLSEKTNKVKRHWATQQLVEERLEAAFFAHPEGEHAALFSRSIQLLRSLRALESSSNSS